MTHPLDPLVDGILDRARREGRLMPGEAIDGLLSDFRTGARQAADPADLPDLRRVTVQVLAEMIAEAERERARMPGPAGEAFHAARIADLRHRLASELQAVARRTG